MEPKKSLSAAEKLRLTGWLTEPAVLLAIRKIDIPPGSKGLDVGCGIGMQTAWLAEEAGPAGKITAVDISSEHLNAARKTVAEKGLSDRVRFFCEDLHRLPFKDNSFDWAWSMNTLFPVPGMDPLQGVAELGRVVKSGGSIAVFFWSGQFLLPGYPLLEACLNLAHASTNPCLKDIRSPLHFMHGGGWLRGAGLEKIDIRSFTVDIQAPLSSEKREALAFCFSMFWDDCQDSLSVSERTEYRRLCDPQSKDCILNDPDYYGLIIHTLFRAKVPES